MFPETRIHVSSGNNSYARNVSREELAARIPPAGLVLRRRCSSPLERSAFLHVARERLSSDPSRSGQKRGAREAAPSAKDLLQGTQASRPYLYAPSAITRFFFIHGIIARNCP